MKQCFKKSQYKSFLRSLAKKLKLAPYSFEAMDSFFQKEYHSKEHDGFVYYRKKRSPVTPVDFVKHKKVRAKKAGNAWMFAVIFLAIAIIIPIVIAYFE